LVFLKKDLSQKHGGTMHTCAHDDGRILFAWELRKRARGRRWFYTQLENLLAQLPPEGWRKIGDSVYLMAGSHSEALRQLLRRFEGADLKWYEFRVEV